MMIDLFNNRKVSQLEKENAKLKRQLKKMMNLHGKTAGRLREKRQQLKSAHQDITTGHELREMQQREIESQKIALAYKERCIDEERVHVMKLSRHLDKVDNRLRKKRKQYRELNARFQELPEAVAKINSMAFDLGIAETNLKTNRETIENLKMVADGWKRQFDEKEKELEKLKNGVDDAKNFIQLEKSYDELYDRHQDALKQIRPLEEEVERLTKSDEQREEFIVHLESQYDQLCESHAQIRSENTIKISELEATVKTLACLLGKE